MSNHKAKAFDLFKVNDDIFIFIKLHENGSGKFFKLKEVDYRNSFIPKSLVQTSQIGFKMEYFTDDSFFAGNLHEIINKAKENNI